jgi:hypothetical protein
MSLKIARVALAEGHKKAYVRVNQLDLVRLKGRGLNWWQMRKISLLSHALHDE